MKIILFLIIFSLSTASAKEKVESRSRTCKESTVPSAFDCSTERFSTQYFSIDKIKIPYVEEPALQKLGRYRAASGPILAQINNNEIFIISQSGRISTLHLDNNKVVHNTLPNISSGLFEFPGTKRYNYVETGPRILGAVVVNNTLYVSLHIYNAKDDLINAAVISHTMDSNNLEWKQEWLSLALDVSYYALGSGGKLSYKDNYFYLTVGDQSLDRKNGAMSDFAAQNPILPWGKVLYFKLVDNKLSRPVVCSIGHRNPSGLVLRKNRGILVFEHGPRGGDEINNIKCGKNYGWPYFSYGTAYQSYGVYPSAAKPLMYEDPIYYFTPSIAVSSAVEIIGFSQEWDGNILLGTLKDQSLYRIKFNHNGSVQNVERILFKNRVRDIVQVSGSIVISTDSSEMFVLKKSDENLYVNQVAPVSKCIICHAINNSKDASYGPNLYNLFGREVGGLASYEYSSAFKIIGTKRKWDQESLSKFLKNPNAYIPGTKMPVVNLTDFEIQQILEYFKKQGL
jgi:cytochrome c2